MQEYQGVTKNVYGDTKVFLSIQCHSSPTQYVTVGWMIRETQVFNIINILVQKLAINILVQKLAKHGEIERVV